MKSIKTIVKIIALLSVMAVITIGCNGLTPINPIRSEYFKTNQAKIVVNKGDAHYELNYEILKNLSEPVYVQLEFENPAPGGEPIVIHRSVKPGEQFLDVKSPMLPGIRNNKYYLTILKVYNDKAETEQISVHRQYIDFSMLNADIARQGVKQYP